MSATSSSTDQVPFPLPVVTDETAPFWTSVREHSLRLPRCGDCGRFFFPPAQLCPNCWSEQITFEPVTGKGTIVSFVTFQRVYHPAFAELLPYDVGVIELEEGPRLLSRIVGRESGRAPEVGAAVEVCYDDLTEEATLPLFRVLGDEEEGGGR